MENAGGDENNGHPEANTPTETPGDAAVGVHDLHDVGRMLYMADFLEPGRDFDGAARAALAARVPAERQDVLREVAGRRITWIVRSGWALPPETVDFWNALVSA